jgi:pimeloyl-ACP methyl ester carboxylesterase
MSGLAEMTMEVLQALGVDRAVVYGWSLGGHIALELVPRFPGLVGLMLTATPACHPTPESLFGAYRPHPMVPLIAQETLSEAEMELFATTVFGAALDDDASLLVGRLEDGLGGALGGDERHRVSTFQLAQVQRGPG